MARNTIKLDHTALINVIIYFLFSSHSYVTLQLMSGQCPFLQLNSWASQLVEHTALCRNVKQGSYEYQSHGHWFSFDLVSNLSLSLKKQML